MDRSDGREIVLGTAMGLVIGILLSWGAVYGLNRYLGPDAEPSRNNRQRAGSASVQLN